MKHIHQILRCPRGTDPRLVPWHHFWLAIGLTALGLLLGWLSLALAASSYPEFSPEELAAWYQTGPGLLLLNLLPPVLLIWTLYFLCGRCWLAYLLTAVPVLALSAVNYFKVQLRGDPLLASDLSLVSEANGIVGKYTLEMTPLLQNSLLWAALGLALALLLLPRGLRRRDIRLFGFLSMAALCATAFVSLYCSSTLYEQSTGDSEWINPWSDEEVFASHGFLYPFLYSVQDLFPTPPEGYNAGHGQEVLARYTEADIPEAEKVSVVGVMLEAFCDLTDFPALAENASVQEVYEPWHALTGEGVTGRLLTNIFAGGTVDTEWCFLTGYSEYGKFQNAVDSYVWYFDRQGYQTRGGHPGFGWFYDRENINQLLGFQEYWFTENHYGELVDPVEAQWNSDDILVEEIVKDLQNQLENDGQPVFSFSVSYQNHGPYESDHTSYTSYLDPETTGFPEESCNVFNNYLFGIQKTIASLCTLAEELEDMEEPVVLVLFGDHKPWGGNGNTAYEGIGANFDTSTLEGFYEYYATPYLIWANSAAKETLGRDFQGYGGDFSPCFLMTELFEQCGWTGPAFLQLAEDTRQVTPLVHQQGIYLDRSGNLTDTLDGRDGEALEDFLYAQYYREHKITPNGEAE